MLTTPKHELPEIPEGLDFARDTFWWTYRRRFILPKTIKNNAWEWYWSEQRRSERRGASFPPKPTFVKAAVIPQVWTGKEEKGVAYKEINFHFK